MIERVAMKHSVSKTRAQKTKSRQKQAERAGSPPRDRKDHPAIRAAIAFVLWIGVAVILGMDRIQSHRPNPWELLPLAGQAILLLAGLFATGMFLELVRPALLRHTSSIAFLSLVSLMSILVAKGTLYVIRSGNLLPPSAAIFSLPFALAPLITTLLLDGTVAVAVGVWTAMVIALMVEAPYGFPMFVMGIVTSIVAACVARQARKRSTVTQTGLMIGLTQITCVFAVTAIGWEQSEVSDVLTQAGICLISGFLSALAVLVVLPAFERAFELTSNISLLELSDLGHSLMQRLALEAPGTYHHSLVVANLAQAAADEIGANSLLARVGSYFHDIGKLVKPRFFGENLQRQSNPHDELPPSMSTLVITSHVKEGISLAILHKLPASVMKIISEHHGTSLLSCFHHKAMSQMEQEHQTNGSGGGKKALDDIHFRYPGPRPSSRESAIICLADAVEAASRTMEKTSPSHIEGLVREIVNRRLEDGQFIQCDLSLSDLERVQQSFVFTLTNMLHGRIPYPKDEYRDQQSAKTSAGEEGEDRPSDPTLDGSGHSER